MRLQSHQSGSKIKKPAALVHDFLDACWRDVRRNGQVRYADPDMLLNSAKCGSTVKHTQHPINSWLSFQPSSLPRAVSTESFCAYLLFVIFYSLYFRA